MTGIISTVLYLTISSSVALLLAALGEMVNQRAGIFNLGCEGVMSIGAFLGMLIPYAVGKGQAVSGVYNFLGLVAATAAGAVLGLFFGIFVITFRAPQGIAGIGLQMFGVGVAGTLFRHFIGGTQSIPGISLAPFKALSGIPLVGQALFGQNIMVYIAFLCVPLTWYLMFKTPWGLKARACGTTPRAADSLGIEVNKVRYQSLMVGGALAGLAGAYLTLCQVKMFSDSIVSGRGFIAVALVYFGHWQPVKIMWGALLFSLAQIFQTVIQSHGIQFPYEFAVMLPYVLVIVVLAFDRESQKLGPTALGAPFDREIRT